MKIELEDIESCVKKISIEVPLERVNEEKSAIYAEISKTASLPGFRKGKVPRSIIEKRFAKSVLGDAANKVIQDAYREAIESKNLRPVGEPAVDNVKIEENEPISFTATVEVFPEVKLEEIKGLKFERKIRPATDKEIGEVLDNYRERNARFEPVEDRGVDEDDYPMIDYSATKDGEKIDVLSGSNKQVRIAKEDMLGDVHKNLLGMKKGEEKTFESELPKEFPDPELAGAKVDFTVKVNEIKRKVLPELDDQLAKEVSSFDTLDELKADLKKNIEQRNESMADNDLREEILGKLIELHSIDLPPKLVEANAHSIAERTQRRFAQQGIDMSSSGLDNEKFMDKYREDSVREIKEQAILAAYAEAKGVEVTDEDMYDEIKSLAQMMGQPVDATKQQLEQSNGLEGLRHKTMTDKVYKAMMSEMTIEDKIVEEDK